MVDMVAIHFD